MINAWKLMTKANDDFIKFDQGYNKIILRLLYGRGLKDEIEINRFLNPDFRRDFLDPFLYKDMAAAVEMIIGYIKGQNLIVVYGDYDADGVTAVAVMFETLSNFKANVQVYIPDRTSEGYGLNERAIQNLAAKGAKLIITVDNGIRNKKEVLKAKELGMEVIITDHHEAPISKTDLPDCLIINPVLEGKAPAKLAGVGVSFKLAKALISRAKIKEPVRQRLTEKLLDLVALGTVADCVSLIGENRSLVYEGINILNRRERVGLDELIKISRGNNPDNGKKVNSWQISWQLAPRLNSAGRMDHANTAYELLVTKNRDQAENIAKKLSDTNLERQRITEEIVEKCKVIIEERLKDDKILILCSPSVLSITNEAELKLNENENETSNWPEGIIGLVAGRLCEQYSRPVLVLTKSNGEIKGSGRSIDEFDITKAIEMSKDNLVKFGGHAAACGFTLKSSETFNSFRDDLRRIANIELAGMTFRPALQIEAELELSEIDEGLVEDLMKFEPYGENNLRPKFLSLGVIIKDKTVMGNNSQHVKFRFNGFWAVCFGQAESCLDYKIGDKVDLVHYLEFNEFNGRRTIQMKVVDIRKSE